MLMALLFAAAAAAAEFGTQGGPGPVNVDAIVEMLRRGSRTTSSC